jgi:hypothetical protein
VLKNKIKIILFCIGFQVSASSFEKISNVNEFGIFLKMETGLSNINTEKFGLYGQITGGKWFTEYFDVYMGIQQFIRSSPDKSFTGVFLGSDLTLFEYEQILLSINVESQIDFDKDFYFSPGIELDYYLKSSKFLGMHICLDEVFQNRDTSWSEDDTETTVIESNADKIFYPQTELKIGYTVKTLPGQLFLFTINPLIRNHPLQGEKIVKFECVAFCYTFNLNYHFQVTTELNIGIPQETEKTKIGIKFLVSTI